MLEDMKYKFYLYDSFERSPKGILYERYVQLFKCVK